METVARRIAQIVEDSSGEGGKPRGHTSAVDCIDPNLRAAFAKKTREDLDFENLRGKITEVTGAGRQGGGC